MKERRDLTKKIAKYTDPEGEYSQAGEGYELASGILAKFESRFGDEGRQMLTEVFTSLEKSGDEGLVQSGWTKFMESIDMSKVEA
jgi:hypothetical protein